MKPRNPQPLIEVAEWLEAGAPHVTHDGTTVLGFNMAEGVVATYADDPSNPHCGTVCCIAGAVVQFNNPIWDDEQALRALTTSERGHFTGSYGTTFSRAMTILGIDGDTASALFEPSEITEWNEISTEQAAWVIRNYLATGEIHWEDEV